MSLVTTTQTSAPRRGRRLLTGFSALALVFVLAGCGIFSPISTENVYNPGDGAMLDLGDVVIRDLVVVGAAEDGPAVVIAYVVNSGSEDAELEFSTEAASASVTVPAGTAQQISPPGQDTVQLDTLGVTPGSVLRLTVTLNDNPPASVNVTALGPDNPIYEQFGSGS